MKGITEFSEDFLHMAKPFIVIIGAFGLFLVFISYELRVTQDSSQRDLVLLGNALLSSNCLTDGRKGVFTEAKLDIMEADSSCFNYPYGGFTVDILDSSKSWEIVLGGHALLEYELRDIEDSFSVLVKLDTGEIKQAEMVVFL
jgi:hypothetical protein